MAGTVTASVVKNDTTSPPQFQNSAGTEIGRLCRAFVNFAGSTGTISAGYNVSSVTRNGTGDYTVNFSSAMPDTNYTMLGGFGNGSGSLYGTVDFPYSQAPTTTTARLLLRNSSNAATDAAYVSVAIFR